MLVQSGTAPLYVAAENGHLEVVKALLAAGANKEAAFKVSGTPTVCTRMCPMSLFMRCCPRPWATYQEGARSWIAAWVRRPPTWQGGGGR